MYIYILMRVNNNYLKIIDKIEKIRSKNNVNWMNILRLAFKLDPKKASKIMSKINYDDKKISVLLNQLSKK
jgi:hypothetical protein